jgi:hypothetical protein
MSSGEAASTHSVAMGGHKATFPAFRVQGRTVWGLTHQMLADLLSLSAPDAGQQLSHRLPKERPLP